MQGGGYDFLSKEEYCDLFYCFFEEIVENVVEIFVLKWMMVVVVLDVDLQNLSGSDNRIVVVVFFVVNQFGCLFIYSES